MKKNKGFGTPQEKCQPLLLLVGDGVSPDVLAKDPNIQKTYPGITAKEFIWIKATRMEEFGSFPKTIELQTDDGKIQRIYKIPKDTATQLKKTRRVYIESDINWSKFDGLS
jgi:hypothetical protein